ncbi:MAG: menaquinone biosynthetic enzyme MqnA/MqnD family protein [Longimicrobiaceae bacterium]
MTPAPPLRLGHINYSNCLPIHAGVIERPPAGVEIVAGVPSELNRLLERGEIDVAPCSSVEYARHADRYRLLPGLAIGSRGAVRSIVFLSDREPGRLHGRKVALPNASATSVVLLRVLFHARYGAEPEYFWFDQRRDDPFELGADAALFIGDTALRPGLHPERRVRLDLGTEWADQTGLPLAFALWQTRAPVVPGVAGLHRALLASRERGLRRLDALARKSAASFGVAPSELAAYWGGLSYGLDAEMREGLHAFYQLAAEIGEVPEEPALRWAV